MNPVRKLSLLQLCPDPLLTSAPPPPPLHAPLLYPQPSRKLVQVLRLKHAQTGLNIYVETLDTNLEMQFTVFMR